MPDFSLAPTGEYESSSSRLSHFRETNMTKLMRLIPAVLLLIQPTLAANWPHWRGPNFNGSIDEKNLPATWSKTENVAWKAPLPGPSGSSPVIWGDHIFVSSPDAQKNLNLICLNRKEGSALWQKQVGIGD